MAKPTGQEQSILEERVAQLEAILAQIGYQTPKKARRPEDRPDYLEFGSEKHALFLGLKKAGEDDADQIDGWALADMTAYGPAARPEFLHEILRQKVNEWKSGKPQVHAGAPPLWMPAPQDQIVSGIV